MTDRELLEFAAKAARYVSTAYDWQFGCRILDGSEYKNWNPLTDDGDALRLAVKVERFDLDRMLVDLDIEDAKTATNRDPYAATRRAIVRAAAEIGKAMQ